MFITIINRYCTGNRQNLRILNHKTSFIHSLRLSMQLLSLYMYNWSKYGAICYHLIIIADITSEFML